jgi:FkbM family methyltransferase
MGGYILISKSVRKPVFMKMWEDHPKVWKLLIDVGIFIKYKTLNIQKLPSTVVLPSSQVIYVNTVENRGRALLISRGVTQKRLYNFWEKSVQKYLPDLIIDVGVNYGECIFSTSYPNHSKIYGIEANHQLIPYIKKSKEAHPNHSQMSIIHAFASDKDDEQKDFYIDQHWSGTSSASYIPSHNMIEKVPVKTITVDSLFYDDLSYETVLFKVDVEGYEAFVLKGMFEIFKNCYSAIGFIEFNSKYIEKSGVNADDLYLFLKSNFKIYIYLEDDTLIKADYIEFEDLQFIFGGDYIHTDIILVTGNERMEIDKDLIH